LQDLCESWSGLAWLAAEELFIPTSGCLEKKRVHWLSVLVDPANSGVTSYPLLLPLHNFDLYGVKAFL
jgi:hypothetical protein